MDFMALTAGCAPFVHQQTLHALVKVESGFNPFAIGVVRGRLERQPRNVVEAVATAKELERLGYNYSVGLAQVNKHNFRKYGLSIETAFDPCQSLRAGGEILRGCFQSAKGRFSNDQHALRGAFSCYYSGNFQTGFRPDFKGQPSYVDKVVGNAIPLVGGQFIQAQAPVQQIKHLNGSYVPRGRAIIAQPSPAAAPLTPPAAPASPAADAPAGKQLPPAAAQPKSAMVF